MGYNLWMSDDSRYTLGFRMGNRADAEPAPSAHQPQREQPSEGGERELINVLMEKLAAQLQMRSATT